MVRITQDSDILMNAQKLFLTVNAVDFQGNSDLFVQKNVNLQTQVNLKLTDIQLDDLGFCKW